MEVFDNAVASLKNRFKTHVMEHLVKLEKFATGSEVVSAETVVKFYGSDFDADRLNLHRDMFLDAVRCEQAGVKTLQDVVTYFCIPPYAPLRSLLPEFTQFI